MGLRLEPFCAPDAVPTGAAGRGRIPDRYWDGVLWILRDPEHQGWHDKAVGTWVVKD